MYPANLHNRQASRRFKLQIAHQKSKCHFKCGYNFKLECCGMLLSKLTFIHEDASSICKSYEKWLITY